MTTVERITATALDKKTAKRYAAQIASEQYGRAARKIKYLGGGSFGRAFGVLGNDGKRFVIKFLRVNGRMEKETHDLALLAQSCRSVKLPRVLFTRKADDEIPVDCYGMERIDGKNALFSLGMLLMRKSRRLRFADEVTSALHEIHECTSDKFGDTLRPEYDTWLDFYKPRAQAILNKAEELFANGELAEKVITAMRAAWQNFDRIFCESPDKACLIHGDLNIANIMVERGEIRGFIDPLDSMYADREYDLFQFDNLTGKHFFLRETYTRKYGASKHCDDKCAFYGLFHEVYCYITSGVLVNMIMDPLVKTMNKRLKEL